MHGSGNRISFKAFLQAGSLEVRIRKDADEKYVLQKVIKKISQVVSTLKVQKFQDLKNCSCMNFPVEYYMDQILLESEQIKERTIKTSRENRSLEENIKIEDILDCSNLLTDSKKKKKNYPSLLLKNQASLNSNKNYLLQTNLMKNTILLNNQRDFEKFRNTTRLLNIQT